jgi:hypothetical protein
LSGAATVLLRTSCEDANKSAPGQADSASRGSERGSLGPIMLAAIQEAAIVHASARPAACREERRVQRTLHCCPTDSGMCVAENGGGA